jgi:glucose/arabinose dehydrogenase
MGRQGLLVRLFALGLLALLLAEFGPAWADIGARRVVRCRRSRPVCIPTAFAFVPGGRRVFYTEKDTGQIRVRFIPTGQDTRWTTIPDIATAGSQGLLGVALDPEWSLGPMHRWVYAYHTDEGMEDPATPGEDTPDRNVIVRMRKVGSTLEKQELLAIPDAVVPHNGGVLRFGPDGKLYAVVGDGKVEARAQDPADPAGKVLRMNPDGSVPADNPFAGDPPPGGFIYSFGHRNSFGFTFDPWTGRLWETENGPLCNDEINVVVPGGNYAWGPNQSCGSLPPPRDTNQDGPEPRIMPTHTLVKTIAPTGAAFCRGCGLGPVTQGDLLVASFKYERILAFDLNAARTKLTRRRTLFLGNLGAMAVQRGPDRRIYFSDPTGIWVLVRRDR